MWESSAEIIELLIIQYIKSLRKICMNKKLGMRNTNYCLFLPVTVSINIRADVGQK